MKIQGLIQAAGSGTRLGLGPKAFVELGGETLLERAVHLVASRVDAIIVAVASDDLERAASLVAGDRVRIIVGAASRSQTTRLLIEEATAPWLLLHDVVHPFADGEIIDRLLAKALEVGASAPGILNTEFLYDRAGTILHAPGDVIVGQKPVAFARKAVMDGYAALSAETADSDPSLLDVLDRGGVRSAFVTGSASNIKITTPADLRLARALITLDAIDRGGDSADRP